MTKSTAKKRSRIVPISEKERAFAVEMYDQIMDEVDPRLMSQNLSSLESELQGMTTEQKRAAFRDIAASLKEHDARFSQKKESLFRALAGITRTAMRFAESVQKKEGEAAALHLLEDNFRS